MKISIISFCVFLSSAIFAFNKQANLNPMLMTSASLELSLEHPENSLYFAALDHNNQLIVSSGFEDGGSKIRIWNTEGTLLETITTKFTLSKAVFSPDSTVVALCYDENEINRDAFRDRNIFRECSFYYIDKNNLGNNKKIRSVSFVKNVFFINSTNELVFLEYLVSSNDFHLKKLTINDGNVVLEEDMMQIKNPLLIGVTGYSASDKITIIEKEMPDNNLFKNDLFFNPRCHYKCKLNVQSDNIVFFANDNSSGKEDYCFMVNNDNDGYILYSKCGDAHLFTPLDYQNIVNFEFNQGEIFILSEGHIRVFVNGELKRTLMDLSRTIFDFKLNNNSKIIAVLLGDNITNCVEIWDRRTEKVLTKLVDPKISKNGIKQAHSDEIFDIEFDDSGKRLMTLSGNTLKIWYINSCDEQTLRQSLKIDPLGLAPQFPLPRTGEKRKNFNRKDQPKQVSKNY